MYKLETKGQRAKGLVNALTFAATGIVLLAAASAHAQSLVLYTASNPTIEKDILAAFSEAHPDIKVDAVNLSTGPITERGHRGKGQSTGRRDLDDQQHRARAVEGGRRSRALRSRRHENCRSVPGGGRVLAWTQRHHHGDGRKHQSPRGQEPPHARAIGWI